MTDQPIPTAAPDTETTEQREARAAAMREACKDMTCNCCQRDNTKNPVIGVASSGVGAVSFAWCLECIQNGAEPEGMICYLRDDVDNAEGNALHPKIYDGLKTFKDGKYITYREYVAANPRQADPYLPLR